MFSPSRRGFSIRNSMLTFPPFISPYQIISLLRKRCEKQAATFVHIIPFVTHSFFFFFVDGTPKKKKSSAFKLLNLEEGANVEVTCIPFSFFSLSLIQHSASLLFSCPPLVLFLPSFRFSGIKFQKKGEQPSREND